MRELSLCYLFVGCEDVRVVLEVTRVETHINETPNKSMETKYFLCSLRLFHDAWPACANPKDSASSVSRKLVFYRDRVHVLFSLRPPDVKLRRGRTNIRHAAVCPRR